MIDTSKHETPTKVLTLPVTGPYKVDYNSNSGGWCVLGPGFFVPFGGAKATAEGLAAQMNNAYIMGFATALLMKVM